MLFAMQTQYSWLLPRRFVWQLIKVSYFNNSIEEWTCWWWHWERRDAKTVTEWGQALIRLFINWNWTEGTILMLHPLTPQQQQTYTHKSHELLLLAYYLLINLEKYYSGTIYFLNLSAAELHVYNRMVRSLLYKTAELPAGLEWDTKVEDYLLTLLHFNMMVKTGGHTFYHCSR